MLLGGKGWGERPVEADSREKEGETLEVVNTGNSLEGLCYKKRAENWSGAQYLWRG